MDGVLLHINTETNGACRTLTLVGVAAVVFVGAHDMFLGNSRVMANESLGPETPSAG